MCKTGRDREAQLPWRRLKTCQKIGIFLRKLKILIRKYLRFFGNKLLSKVAKWSKYVCLVRLRKMVQSIDFEVNYKNFCFISQHIYVVQKGKKIVLF